MSIIVETQIWHWTAAGMNRGKFPGMIAYVTKAETERLMKEAYESGRCKGLQEAQKIISEA